MKTFSLVAAALSFSLTSFAAPVLICKTRDKVEGWTGSPTLDFVYFTAFVESELQLSRAEIRGAYGSDIRNINIDPAYKPRSPFYREFYRFGALEDAWNWFYPLLPKDFSKQSGSFPAYIQILGEAGFKETLKLTCILNSN